MTKTHNRARSNAKPSRHTHRVLVFSVADDTHQFRDLLVQWLGLTMIDAQIQVHSLPGVLPLSFSQHDAAQLAAAIRELGADATIVADEEVPKLEQPRTVHHARCGDVGLEIVDLYGDRESLIPWEQILLISVGLVSQPTEHRVGVPPTAMVQLANTHRSERPSIVDHDSLELLIVLQDLAPTYRVDHAQMNYEYLGQRMSSSGTANFRRFVQDLVHGASNATLTPATQSFLQHGFARHYQFRSSEELRRYTAFRLLVRNSPTTQLGGTGEWAARGRRTAESSTPQQASKSREQDHTIKANT